MGEVGVLGVLGHALLAVVHGELYYQDGVLGGHTQQKNQSDLRVDADALVHAHTSEHGAQHGHRHGRHHRYGIAPAFILGGQHQYGHDYGEDEHNVHRQSGLRFLIIGVR